MKKLIVLMLLAIFFSGCQSMNAWVRKYHESTIPKAYVQPKTLLSQEEIDRINKLNDEKWGHDEDFSQIDWSAWHANGEEHIGEGAKSHYYDIQLDGKNYKCFDGSIYTSCKSYQ